MFHGQDWTQGSVVGLVLLTKAQEAQILELTLRVCAVSCAKSLSTVLMTDPWNFSSKRAGTWSSFFISVSPLLRADPGTQHIPINIEPIDPILAPRKHWAPSLLSSSQVWLALWEGGLWQAGTFSKEETKLLSLFWMFHSFSVLYVKTYQRLRKW